MAVDRNKAEIENFGFGCGLGVKVAENLKEKNILARYDKPDSIDEDLAIHVY